MATTTPNYGFTKPALTDSPPDITVTNPNWDTLDAELKKISDKANLIPTAGGTATAITLNNVSLVNGFSVTFIVAANNNGAATTINGKALYKPGGTSAPNLIAGKAVMVWYNGTNFFIKASAEGDAVAANVLAGKTFSNDDDSGLTGTMPNNGSVGTINLTTEGAEYTIPEGYHNGLGKVKAVITGLIASVIKAGTTVGGILGTFTSDATATAAQILSGATAYVNGNKVTGTIASKAAQTYTPGTSNQTIAAGQYLSGAQTIAGSANLIEANIKKGVNIFGKVGTYEMPGLTYESGTATMASGAANNAYTFALTKKAVAIFAWSRRSDGNNHGGGFLLVGGSFVGMWNNSSAWAVSNITYNESTKEVTITRATDNGPSYLHWAAIEIA